VKFSAPQSSLTFDSIDVKSRTSKMSSLGVNLIVLIILCLISFTPLRANHSVNLQDSSPKELYQEAARLFQSGGFAQAEIKLREALRIQPQFPEAAYLLALVFAATERVEDAEKYVQQALVQKPDFGEAWHLAGRLSAGRKEFNKAREAFLKASQLNPANAFIPLDLGNTLESLDDNEGAMKAYEKGLALAGQNSRARTRAQASLGLLHVKIASLFTEKNEIQLSIQELEKAQEYLTPSARLYGLLGDAYLMANDLRAVHALAHAAALTSTEEAWEKLAKALSKFGQFDEAVTLFEAKAKEDPNSAVFHLLLGAAYWDKTEYRKAVDEYQRVVILDPQSVRGFYLLASGHQLLGDRAAAKKSLERALSLDPDFKPAQLAMVDVFIAEDKRPEAIALLEQMTAKNKEGPDVQLKLGQLYLETTQFEACLKTLEEAERQAPKEKKVHYLRGRLYTAMNQADLAKKEFDLFSSLEKAEMEEQRRRR
jgi:tetratricopeptide (TPR) repeat protein